MPKFQFYVLESRVVECLYEVQGDDEDDARAAALAGDTLDSTDICEEGVTDRQVSWTRPVTVERNGEFVPVESVEESRNA